VNSIPVLHSERFDSVLQYLSDPAARTIDRVPSNIVWLAQLYCAVQCGDLPMPSAETVDALFQVIYPPCAEE
jgi:hypothetical protein